MADLHFTLDELLAATGGQLHNMGPDSHLSVAGIITDSRIECTDSLFVALRGDVFDGHDFVAKAIESGAALVCVDRLFYQNNTSLTIPLVVVDDTTLAYQMIARFHRRRLGITVIGITGSSGKTSTKDIMYSVLAAEFGEDHVYATKANTNNHIGVPQNLLNLRPNHKVAVIEMGSNHPGEIEVLSRTAEPDIAIITSVGSCHLEFLGTVEGVAREKSDIFRYLTESGTAIIPAQCEYRNILDAAAGDAGRIFFGEDLTGTYHGGSLFGSKFDITFPDGETFPVEWGIHGEHQMSNALAVAGAASVLGIENSVIVDGLVNSSLSGMRMRVRELDGVRWINDAYNANPDSMIAVFKWLDESVEDAELVLVIGDMLELGEVSHEQHVSVLTAAVSLSDSVRVFVIGRRMLEAIHDLSEKQQTNIVGAFRDSATASEFIRKSVSVGDVVFLKASRGMKLEIIEPES